MKWRVDRKPTEKKECSSCSLSWFEDGTLRCPLRGMNAESRVQIEAWRSRVTFDEEGFPIQVSTPCPGWMG